MAAPPPSTSLVVLESGLRLQQLVALRLLLETEVRLCAAAGDGTANAANTSATAPAALAALAPSLPAAIAHANSLLQRSVAAIDAAAAAALAALDDRGGGGGGDGGGGDGDGNNNNNGRSAAPIDAAAATLARANAAADDAVALVREVVAHVRAASEASLLLRGRSVPAPGAGVGGGGGGASEAQVASIPSHIVVGGDGNRGEGEGEDDCAVCLSAVVPGERAKKLDPCGHTYHAACIDAWMRVKARCPLCARRVGFAVTGVPSAAA